MGWLATVRKVQKAKVLMLVEPRNKPKFAWVETSDPEIFPLIACVAVGCAMLGIYLVHNFMENPDLNIRKDRRETLVFFRDRMEEECREFTKYRPALAQVLPNPVNTDQSFLKPKSF